VTEPTRLKPVALPKADIYPADRVTACLERALEDHKLDIQSGNPSRGAMVLFLREYPDGHWGESWVTQGLNTMEALGLLSCAMHDINTDGLDGGPDHWPNGRPPMKEEPTDDPA